MFKDDANGGGPPDLVGRLRQRRPKASLNNNSFPNPPKPKEKPAGLKRRARDLYRRCERGTEARGLSGLRGFSVRSVPFSFALGGLTVARGGQLFL